MDAQKRGPRRGPDGLPPAAPKLILPKYHPEDCFAVFLQFLDSQGCTFTKSMLTRELEALRRHPAPIGQLSKVGRGVPGHVSVRSVRAAPPSMLMLAWGAMVHQMRASRRRL